MDWRPKVYAVQYCAKGSGWTRWAEYSYEGVADDVAERLGRDKDIRPDAVRVVAAIELGGGALEIIDAPTP